MREPVLCRDLLQIIFPERAIREVRIHEDFSTLSSDGDAAIEKTIIAGIESKQVRLDVLFTDDAAWYDIEMQVLNKGNLPKRTRYSHAIVDVDTLESGKEYDDLKPSYVIFLCCFDYFGKNKPAYRFSMQEEENHLPLGDETYTIILNSKASGAVPIPEPLQALFSYMNDGEVTGDNALIQQIDQSVGRWNSGERRRLIMTLEQEILIRENKARAEGREAGQLEERVRIHKLGKAMKASGRSEEFFEALGDSERLSDLFREHDIPSGA